MKRLIRLIVPLSLVFVLSVQALAYDAREARLSDEGDPQALARLAEEIPGYSTGEGIDFDGAVEVYHYYIKDIIPLLEEDQLFQQRESAGSQGWIIPAGMDESAHAFVSASLHADGTYGFSTTSAPYPAGDGAMWFALLPQQLEQVLAEEFPQGYDDLFFATTALNMDFSFVAVRQGEQWRYIAACDRPEFVGLENGQAYTGQELARILDDYVQASSNMAPDEGGGSGAPAVRVLPAAALAVALAVIAAAALFRRRHPNNEP